TRSPSVYILFVVLSWLILVSDLHSFPTRRSSDLFAGAIATILLCFAGPWPDLLLGVLGVGVLICGILAIIGRLPSGFEVAGLRFHFEAEELSNLISTVRSALDTDPDERDEILRLIKQGTGPK